MRNVGGKAGGFINKKFFHPSSLRNQAGAIGFFWTSNYAQRGLWQSKRTVFWFSWIHFPILDPVSAKKQRGIPDTFPIVDHVSKDINYQQCIINFSPQWNIWVGFKRPIDSSKLQEKLWKAITSDAAEKRKQDDLEKASLNEFGCALHKKNTDADRW